MSTQTATVNKTEKRVNVRYLTVTAMLSAVAYILMFLDFSVPFMPAFIKMDLSELPALIGSFAMGPLCGVVVCLIKNVLHLFITTTGGVGELSNFILGVAFVLPAGLIYKHKKNRKSALIGSLAGAAFMGIFSIISNYFLVYPVYYNFMPDYYQGNVFRCDHVPYLQTYLPDFKRKPEPLSMKKLLEQAGGQ